MENSFYLYIFLFGISLLSTYLLFEGGFILFVKKGLVDNPGPYGHERPPVPLGFGTLLYINFLILSGLSALF